MKPSPSVSGAWKAGSSVMDILDGQIGHLLNSNLPELWLLLNPRLECQQFNYSSPSQSTANFSASVGSKPLN
jgi:hypothetical protein